MLITREAMLVASLPLVQNLCSSRSRSSCHMVCYEGDAINCWTAYQLKCLIHERPFLDFVMRKNMRWNVAVVKTIKSVRRLHKKGESTETFEELDEVLVAQTDIIMLDYLSTTAL